MTRRSLPSLRRTFCWSSFAVALLLSLEAGAETRIRWNAAGYLPDAEKSVVIMSDEDLEGQGYQLLGQEQEVLSGVIGASEVGVGAHTSQPYNYHINLTELDAEGDYTLRAGGQEVTISVSPDPYSTYLNDVLRHLRVARSGSDTAALHPASHLGDASCPVYQVEGDPNEGAWSLAEGVAPVDMLGGWYDAGDYIKFTLTISYTTYFLLKSYQTAPELFTKENSSSELVDILDEAQFGLDYLMKTHPSDDLFIIQVSTGQDHNVGWRLPQNDSRDGSREALSAISVPQMGYTAAALALGAQVFQEIDQDKASAYSAMAQKIYRRMRQPDAISTGAFERDPTNDFYHDSSPADNLSLAAFELYRLTGESDYLEAARNERSLGAGWLSWGNVDLHANQFIGQEDQETQDNARAELEYFISNGTNHFWNLPMIYTWASLPSWLSAGAAMGFDAASATPTSGSKKMYQDILDYTFGKNNWGVSFLASAELPNSVQNIYSQIYTLTGEFPQGAVSEGPGDRATHDDMMQYFSGPLDTSLEAFNTEQAVFYDDEKDFMTQESVIVGQAAMLYFLAQAPRLFSYSAPMGEEDSSASAGEELVGEEEGSGMTGEAGEAAPLMSGSSESGGCALTGLSVGGETRVKTGRLHGLVLFAGLVLVFLRRRSLRKGSI
ncbi:MAG: glycoside hydrolase family 9 protein [Polyangiaceae bacterium]|nr:glycoside hydrolase family 9 protein [Polyangiaceae bacterium]